MFLGRYIHGRNYLGEMGQKKKGTGASSWAKIKTVFLRDAIPLLIPLSLTLALTACPPSRRHHPFHHHHQPHPTCLPPSWVSKVRPLSNHQLSPGHASIPLAPNPALVLLYTLPVPFLFSLIRPPRGQKHKNNKAQHSKTKKGPALPSRFYPLPTHSPTCSTTTHNNPSIHPQDGVCPNTSQDNTVPPFFLPSLTPIIVNPVATIIGINPPYPARRHRQTACVPPSQAVSTRTTEQRNTEKSEIAVREMMEKNLASSKTKERLDPSSPRPSHTGDETRPAHHSTSSDLAVVWVGALQPGNKEKDSQLEEGWTARN